MDPDSTGEVRKTVTVLFVDMVGSTDLGERLDPEVLRDVMQRYYQRMAAAVQERGGTLEKFIGDAIFAVFGVPDVGEDDAMRAVEAAVAMRSSLATLNAELTERWGVEIQTRAGVSTGEIVVGDEARVDQLVMGDVANVAARLQSAAGAGEVVIAESTARLVREAVDLDQIEPLTLKGKRDPVIAFRVLGLLAPEARTVTSAPFVGRTTELEALEAELSEAIRLRSCRFAAIVGDPGIGKSRLVSEFVASRGSSATVLRTQCEAHGHGSAMHPFADLVRQLAGISPADDRRGARAKLEALIERIGIEDDTSDALASLLDLTDSVRPLEDIYRGVRRVLESVAQQLPAILVIDDLHHADRASLDLIEYLLRVTRDAPVLIVSTRRLELVETGPSFVPEGGKTISLSPLPTEAARMLIDGLVGTGQESLDGVRIEEAAEGNPLFIEQLALMLQEPRRVAGGETSGSGVSREALVVPPSISALLDTRVHALSHEERSVVQRASVIGRSFGLEAVAELLPENARSSLPSMLQRLVRAGILRLDDVSMPGDASFAHGLIRDSAYRSLLKSQRADLHERCADHLERTRGERVTEHSVSIGSHLEEAVRNRMELGSDEESVRPLSTRAARWLATAGRAAIARGDTGNAVDLLGRATALLPEEEPERPAVLADLGIARSDLGELALAEAALSEVVARSSPAEALHWRARVDLAQLVLVADPGRIEPDTVRRTAEDAIDVLAGVRDERGLARANYTLASVLFVAGRSTEGLEYLELALVHAQHADDARTIAGCVGDMGYVFLYDPTPAAAAHERLAELARAFPDARASVLGPMAAMLAMLDRFDEARRSLEERRGLAEEFNQRWALAQTDWWAGFVETLAGELTSAESRLRAALAISIEMGIPRMSGGIAGDLAEVVYQLGRPEEAFAIAEELRTNPPGDDALARVIWRGVHGKVLAAAGRTEEAERELREGLLVPEGVGAAMISGRLLMDLAEVLAIAGKKDEAVQAADDGLRLYAAKGSLPSVRAAEGTLRRILAGPELGRSY